MFFYNLYRFIIGANLSQRYLNWSVGSGGRFLPYNILTNLTLTGAQDFVISTVNLTFTPDQAIRSVEMMITDDVIAELTESLTVIVGVVNRGIGQSTEVIIKDDDSK